MFLLATMLEMQARSKTNSCFNTRIWNKKIVSVPKHLLNLVVETSLGEIVKKINAHSRLFAFHFQGYILYLKCEKWGNERGY